MTAELTSTDDGHQHTRPAARDRGRQHDGRHEEDEGDARLRDRKDRPVKRRCHGGQQRREGEPAWRGFLDPRPEPRQAKSRVIREIRAHLTQFFESGDYPVRIPGFSDAPLRLPAAAVPYVAGGVIDPGPFRRLRGPDGRPGPRQFGVIERPVAHDDEMRTRFRFAENCVPQPGQKRRCMTLPLSATLR